MLSGPNKYNVMGELTLPTKALWANSTLQKRLTRGFRPHSDQTKKVTFRANCLFLGQIVIFRANCFRPPPPPVKCLPVRIWPSTSGFTVISQVLSECWLVDLVQWPVGPFYLSLPPWLRPSVTPLKLCKIRNVKRRIFWHFWMSSEIISFLIKKWTCATNRGLIVRGVTRGARGAQIPWRRVTMGVPNHCGSLKSPNNVTSTFFNRVHLLPKDVRFEHGGAKLTSSPGRHLTSLCPCVS